MFDILKILLLIIVLTFVYLFLRANTTTDVGWSGVLNNREVVQITNEELWSNQSIFRGLVSITKQSRPNATEPTEEYVHILARRSNDISIDMTGWSLYSVVSNTRVYLPPATLMLKMSGNNKIDPVHLAPGEFAVISTGKSPIHSVASSFHTNKCIGYVARFHRFVPPISSRCNDPSLILPPTPQNIRTYGSTCIEFLAQAESCKSYTNEMPAHLLPACRDLIARKLTYHSCLSDGFAKYGHDIFNDGGWYLYLNHNAELWRNSYEIIKLLDADGLTVDVLRY